MPTSDESKVDPPSKISLGLTLTTLVTAGAYLILYAYDCGLASFFDVNPAYISIGNEQIAALAAAIIASGAFVLFAFPILAIIYISLGVELVKKWPKLRVVFSRLMISMTVFFVASDLSIAFLSFLSNGKIPLMWLAAVIIVELISYWRVPKLWKSIDKSDLAELYPIVRKVGFPIIVVFGVLSILCILSFWNAEGSAKARTTFDIVDLEDTAVRLTNLRSNTGGKQKPESTRTVSSGEFIIVWYANDVVLLEKLDRKNRCFGRQSATVKLEGDHSLLRKIEEDIGPLQRCK